MKRNHLLGVVLITSAVAASGAATAADAPSKRSEPVPPTDAASVPKAESVEVNPKRTDRLKWDQLDPKAVERSAKRARPKSPFSAVPPER